MAKVSLSTIKNWFKTGLKPTQAQFWDTWDSFRHKDDQVAAAEVIGLDALLSGKAETTHLADPNAHNALFEANGLQVVELDWRGENPMDPAGITPIDFLNNLSVPLVLTKRSIVKIKYRFTVPSDGDVAVTNQWMLLLLEAGSYGSGFPAATPIIVNDASLNELQLSSKQVKLSSATALNVSDQDAWNEEVENKLTINNKPTFYKHGIRLLPSEEISWDSNLNFDFSPGRIFFFKGTFEILFPDVPFGFTNLFQFDSLDDTVAGRKLSVMIGYFDSGNDSFSFSITLQETIDNVSFRQCGFVTPKQMSVVPGVFDINLNVEVRDISISDLKFTGSINGNLYSLDVASGVADPGTILADFSLISQPWSFVNFPKKNRVNFLSNFPGQTIWNILTFGVDDDLDTLYFKGNEPFLVTEKGYKVSNNGVSINKQTGGFVLTDIETGQTFKGNEQSFRQSPSSSIEVENRLISSINSANIFGTFPFSTLNKKFIRKSLRKLYDEEIMNSPYLTGLFLPEVNDLAIAGSPPSLTGALFNILNFNNKFVLNRTTVKYRHRESLLIEEVGISHIAVDYLNGFPELIVEPQRTNLVKDSEPIANENGASALTTYSSVINPFGFASFVTLDKTETTAFRYAGSIADDNFYQHQYYYFTNGFNLQFKNDNTIFDSNYEVVNRGNTGAHRSGFLIKDRNLTSVFRKMTVNCFANGFVNDNNNGLIHRNSYPNLQDIIYSGIGLYPANDNSFEGSYIRTAGASKTVDADVFSISNLLTDGLVSVSEGTIIERGSNQEVRTVWTGGNRLKFIDNALVSTVAEVPNNNVFTLDTSSYRLSEILIFNTAILP